MKKIVLDLMLVLIFLCSCSSQKTDTESNFKTITGVVIGIEDNLPVAGASIQVKQKRKDAPKKVTTTDVYGRFTIEVKKGEILIISCICFEPKEIKITDKDKYRILLKPNCRIWI